MKKVQIRDVGCDDPFAEFDEFCWIDFSDAIARVYAEWAEPIVDDEFEISEDFGETWTVYETTVDWCPQIHFYKKK